jgi:hypothetical protein
MQQGTGIEAALLTTFDAYFPFFEEVVLRRLRASGCHYVVTLMDSRQLAMELAEHERRPLFAGRQYGLLPVDRGGVFHPKLALLVGPKSARVLIGSHNLTMSGFVRNREMTNVVEVMGPKDRVGAAVLLEALEFCRAWASDLPKPLLQTLEDFRGFCRPYLGPVPGGGDTQVIGSRPTGPSLWQKVRELVPKKVQRVVILGPFFDEDLSFVRRVIEDLGVGEVLIAIDPETTHFPGKLKKLPREVRIVNSHDLDPGHRGRGYLHAKAMLIESGATRVLVTGSANPTAAAWLASSGSRNAELVVIRKLPARGGDDLGLGGLWRERALPACALTALRARPERLEETAGVTLPLVGFRHGAAVRVEGPFRRVSGVTIRDARGRALASEVRTDPKDLVIEVGNGVDDASTIEATLEGVPRRGFVHHGELLRESAASSSQRRLREALMGLNGDPSQLEGLLRLVEKVIFDGPAVETVPGRKESTRAGAGGDSAEESTTAIVQTLGRRGATEARRLSSGDIGLLIDILMRKLWRSQSHEHAAGSRPEVDLIGSDDEDAPAPEYTDREIAEAWCRKSRTLLRRLARRVEQGSDAVQIVMETTAVLGVLEALRRVEDQDRWRALRLELVDRDEAMEFVFTAIPRLFQPRTGLLDTALREAGAFFAEHQSLVEWTTWLAWLTGFGPIDAWELADDQDYADDDYETPTEIADRLARACLIGAHVADSNDGRILELLDASPFPGENARVWLKAFVRLGAAYRDPAGVPRLARSPALGDLVITEKGRGPFVVRLVRANKVDLIDFEDEEQTATFFSSGVRVLDIGLERVRRAVG